MRALIVDDSAVMRKVIERSLRQAGIELTDVLQAGNGAEALEVLRGAPALDLILSDINMPEMDGLAFLEGRTRENLAAGTPVVMITTEASQPQVLRALGRRGQGLPVQALYFRADQVTHPAVAAGRRRQLKGARPCMRTQSSSWTTRCLKCFR